MPALAALGDIRADAGHGDVDDRQRADLARMGCGQGEGGRPAPVVADQMKPAEAELRHQFMHVGRDGRLVVAVRRPRGIAQATQVGRDHAVLAGEPVDDVPPLVPVDGQPCRRTTGGPSPAVT